MAWSQGDWDRFFDALGEGDLDPFKKWVSGRIRNFNVFDPEYALSPLHHAARVGDVEMIDILLDSGAKIDIRRHKNITPLMDALQFHKPEAIKALVHRGADTNARDETGDGLEAYIHTPEAEQALRDAKKEQRTAVAQVMVKTGMPQKVIGKNIMEFAGIGKGRSRLNKKTRRRKTKRVSKK